jgi:adenylate kinase family enzyme
MRLRSRNVSAGTRIIVVGTSGTGKTTLAADIARRVGVPHVELDALHWLPDWLERPDTEFRQLVVDAASGENWVADGNYAKVRDILWPRGTAVVWLNYSRMIVMTRVVRRTLQRAIFRTPLFSGNRESLRMSFFSRDSILLWAWTSYRSNQETYRRIRESGEFPHLRWVELRSPKQTTDWLRSEPCVAP